MTNHRSRPVKVINLTGRPLTVEDEHGRQAVLRSGRRAKVYSTVVESYLVQLPGGVEVPVLELENAQEIQELPAPEDGVLYVVSGLVATAAHRKDVVVPSRTNRDEASGRIVSCSAFLVPNYINE
jgi:hypothetical protein